MSLPIKQSSLKRLYVATKLHDVTSNKTAMNARRHSFPCIFRSVQLKCYQKLYWNDWKFFHLHRGCCEVAWRWMFEVLPVAPSFRVASEVHISEHHMEVALISTHPLYTFHAKQLLTRNREPLRLNSYSEKKKQQKTKNEWPSRYSMHDTCNSITLLVMIISIFTGFARNYCS